MRMDLPHWTFSSVRKLRISWCFKGSPEHQDDHEPEEALFYTFASHMQQARKYLPSLESVAVWVNLTGHPPEDMDPHTERVRALVYFLKGISHVREIELDLRDTTHLQTWELKEILRGCSIKCSHTSVALALRSTTPSLTEGWSETHEADDWSFLVARFLRKTTLQSLKSLWLCIEVPQAGRPAEIFRATKTCLKVSTYVAQALHQQMVTYISDGTAVLKDADGMPLTSGLFYAEKVNDNFIKLWDNENSARTARRNSLYGNHTGRQHFTPALGSSGGLGCLLVILQQPSHGVPVQTSGVAAIADVLKSVPNLNVTLEGSGFRSPFLQALPNAQIQANQFEDEKKQDDTTSSSPSDEDTSSSSSTD